MSAEQLIIKHLDIWTSAHKTRSSAGRGSSNKLDLYGIKKLRELILELAVSGKLIKEHEPSDYKNFVEQVLEEKKRVITEIGSSKIKEISDESDIRIPKKPHHWILAKVNEVFITTQGVQIQKAEQSQIYLDGYDRYLYISDFKNNDEIKYVKDIYPNKRVTSNDLVMANTGSPGEVYFGVPGILSNNLFKLSYSQTILYQKFVFYYFKSPSFTSSLKKMLKGGAQQHLGHKLIGSQYLVIPTLDEQYRIVAKVEELMAFCDELEQAQTDNIAAHAQLVEALLTTLTNSKDHQELQANWQRIAEHFDTLFTTEDSIDQLKQTILQLAVMGKLVPQDPNDEPASELLKKIAAEKAQLIKEGKIKKEKPLPEITDEEKSFELPYGWEWAHLVDCGVCSTGGTPKTSDSGAFGGEVPFIGPGQITPDGMLLEADKFLTEKGCQDSSICDSGDILMVCIGGSIGKSLIANRRLAFNQQINCIQPIFIQSEYLNSMMNTGFFQSELLSKSTGSATPIINKGKWEELCVAVPPIMEQKRIVSKIDELIAFCNTMKTCIKSAQDTQIKLVDTLIEHSC